MCQVHCFHVTGYEVYNPLKTDSTKRAKYLNLSSQYYNYLDFKFD